MYALLDLSVSRHVQVDSTAPPLHRSSLAALEAFAQQDQQQTALVQQDRSVKIQSPFQSVLLGHTALFDPHRRLRVCWVSFVPLVHPLPILVQLDHFAAMQVLFPSVLLGHTAPLAQHRLHHVFLVNFVL